ncbi:glycoside hydrolase family 3 C-terminal domain-containing protein [Actinotalea sp. M2MS4P-6]|uniref:beta-glucosidase family protein n=1 Tax=Actinotalea sp. M2MS4P-6 TaxID=2983762 RepID=UPI0021E491C4|nr:glycoside hydrolase family 3 C-terminal domain-containing protein [Actinotalea sp. M2MS4P-6]MCV2394221.1 glycoside hydrolase family 3 C-terminal domain-containing protein [Actinotalea sp. M2MS4P-6]
MTTDPHYDVAALTLEEKASLVTGRDVWRTAEVERLGIGSVMVTDGPHGLRKQEASPDELGLGASVPATCFPTAAALGSSWDDELVRRVGVALGDETRANDVAVLLGPGINIKRSPLCGRNFEYVSEDPLVSGRIGAALVQGIQSRGVGTSLKHYAANNQETDRMRVSAEVDERTLREIYLAGFEHVVRTAQPWTIMCSYNRVNGVRVSENPWLLTQVLRDEWGYEGLVMSDWGAVWDLPAAVDAGLDLEMPGTGGRTAADVVAAVRSGRLDEAALDRAAARVLALVERVQPALADPGTADLEAHHALAREAAAAGAVLLSNDEVEGAPLLPLDRAARIAVIGELARSPRYQGAGSSQVNPTRLDDLLGALEAELGAPVPFAPGFTVAGVPVEQADDAALRAEAVEVATEADVVVLFLGLPAPEESEGFDRTTLELPANQVATLDAVAAANPHVVVVLANGGAVTMPWRQHAPALLETWLGGQAAGSAIADVLLGLREPGGRLTETVPLRLEDTPAFGNFPGEARTVRYGEGVLVGYRWYDTRDLAVAFPFGHGLGYTTFGYGPLTAAVRGTGAETTIRAEVTVTNTGARRGKEVVQLYVADPESAVVRPVHELKDYATVVLEPGESTAVVFELPARALSYWHPELSRWVVEGGAFVLEAGASSRDVRARTEIEVVGEQLWGELTAESRVGEWRAHPVGAPLLADAMASAPELDETMQAMVDEMPARVIAALGLAGFDLDGLDELVARARRG